jgi:hypothetical protein
MLYVEGSNIAVGGQKVRDEDVTGQDTDVVVGDERPDWELGAMRDGTGAKENHDEKSRVPCCSVSVT